MIVKYYGAVQLRFDNEDWLREYAENVTPILRRHGGKYLARTRTMERTEGDRGIRWKRGLPAEGARRTKVGQ